MLNTRKGKVYFKEETKAIEAKKKSKKKAQDEFPVVTLSG